MNEPYPNRQYFGYSLGLALWRLQSNKAMLIHKQKLNQKYIDTLVILSKKLKIDNFEKIKDNPILKKEEKMHDIDKPITLEDLTNPDKN